MSPGFIHLDLKLADIKVTPDGPGTIAGSQIAPKKWRN
jgi:hypothetical protein